MITVVALLSVTVAAAFLFTVANVVRSELRLPVRLAAVMLTMIVPCVLIGTGDVMFGVAMAGLTLVVAAMYLLDDDPRHGADDSEALEAAGPSLNDSPRSQDLPRIRYGGVDEGP